MQEERVHQSGEVAAEPRKKSLFVPQENSGQRVECIQVLPPPIHSR
jgi:hypothetical protein